ncbi:MAG: hypothetical protein OXC45_00560, partial [Gemmatimonadetes bacterium]|nr:hypothetical protein [Gemmatimonadota bacterium]
MKIHILYTIATMLSFFACSSKNPVAPTPSEDSALSGGQATVFDASSQAFEMPIPTLSPDEL